MEASARPWAVGSSVREPAGNTAVRRSRDSPLRLSQAGSSHTWRVLDECHTGRERHRVESEILPDSKEKSRIADRIVSFVMADAARGWAGSEMGS
jgi:hypothetical protein